MSFGRGPGWEAARALIGSRRFYSPGFLRPRTFADVRRVYKLPLFGGLIVRRRTPLFAAVAVKSLSDRRLAPL
jgi:hypothetical protein